MSGEGYNALFRSDVRAANPQPVYANFPSNRAYLEAWYRWRAFNREHDLNPAEAEVRNAGVEQEMVRRMRQKPA